MKPKPSPDWTSSLRRLARGHTDDDIFPLVLEELKATARGCLGPRAAGGTLQATALVHETFMKLFGAESVARIQDRSHFFALAALAMRQIVVDYARQRAAEKRGGGAAAALTLREGHALAVTRDETLLDVDEALAELEELDPRQARIVALRFFGGFEVVEVAAALEVSVSTVEREWRAARAWLGKRLAAEGRS